MFLKNNNMVSKKYKDKCSGFVQYSTKYKKDSTPIKIITDICGCIINQTIQLFLSVVVHI